MFTKLLFNKQTNYKTIMTQTKRIAIFGSTGSIGTQALEVIAAHTDKFSVEILTAHTNDELIIKQALQFKPNIVVIGDERKYQKKRRRSFLLTVNIQPFFNVLLAKEEIKLIK